MSAWPSCAAMKSGVKPSSGLSSGAPAMCSLSSLSVEKMPPAPMPPAAPPSARRRLFTLSFGCCISCATTSRCPPSAALYRGVAPLVMGLLMSTRGSSISSFTTSTCPSCAAQVSGVRPSSFCALMSTPSSISAAMQLSCHSRAAWCSAVLPAASRAGRSVHDRHFAKPPCGRLRRGCSAMGFCSQIPCSRCLGVDGDPWRSGGLGGSSASSSLLLPRLAARPSDGAGEPRPAGEAPPPGGWGWGGAISSRDMRLDSSTRTVTCWMRHRRTRKVGRSAGALAQQAVISSYTSLSTWGG
mmetsp:Transcript_29834/g.65215  ORF Transcript_29834/g.65215 Transcript_29834/m.65215 type:complete len:298 (+) Transcript_29834:1044-1937(+)